MADSPGLNPVCCGSWPNCGQAANAAADADPGAAISPSAARTATSSSGAARLVLRLHLGRLGWMCFLMRFLLQHLFRCTGHRAPSSWNGPETALTPPSAESPLAVRPPDGPARLVTIRRRPPVLSWPAAQRAGLPPTPRWPSASAVASRTLSTTANGAALRHLPSSYLECQHRLVLTQLRALLVRTPAWRLRVAWTRRRVRGQAVL